MFCPGLVSVHTHKAAAVDQLEDTPEAVHTRGGGHPTCSLHKHCAGTSAVREKQVHQQALPIQLCLH
jgi:hypothetical protein